MNFKKSDFGKAITKAVAHQKLTREKMALRIGLSKNHFYALCAGNTPPSLETLENIAIDCNVKLSTVIRWGEE